MDKTMLKRIAKEDLNDIIGQSDVKDQLRGAILMDRHVIIVGPPGIGKTTLAKNAAAMLPELIVNDCGFNCTPEKPVCPTCRSGKKGKTITKPGSERFIRVQGSPDLTAEDLLGDIDPIKAMKYGPLSPEAFIPGKIFKANNGVLFFDELNRCPEKIQNGLLQVLEERYATIGSFDTPLEASFILIATMNPDDSSTEKLADVLLDRFDMIYMKYPESCEIEETIVKLHGKKIVDYPEDLFKLTIQLVRELREDPDLEKVPSVRATLGLYERAQSNAYLEGNSKVSFDDLRKSILSVLSHRIQLKPSLRYLKKPEDFLAEKIKEFTDRNSEAINQKGDSP